MQLYGSTIRHPRSPAAQLAQDGVGRLKDRITGQRKPPGENLEARAGRIRQTKRGSLWSSRLC